MNETKLLQKATKRVQGDKRLRPYRDLLIDYDWQEGEEHLEWVCNAPATELVAWAQGIRDDDAEHNRIEKMLS
jgi:hypothetical protein